ncbi:MAG: carboxymuconolactone decarboxylase family protein [Confluentimicrobium sp.]|jgi:AhpD family alkylhydroperoxidase|uniref:carboxymuconolactone decarboxylase family protein n=1 Tax=Actibacterium sp. TaxID=1872125 RepID=UPI0005103354|nr:carboxymuconolactone decarboxylase family protein [Actibacterium sp.]KGB81383.1 alkylhydroperoxidase [Rhodovulum sp. NI22]MBC56312.1 carboxymuconolactone decarboxylase family protein [Actibacterium sp.]MDY6858805.1 carboxymuconolactone decarboxylase family protein [Pseudomonadota bacterium]|tara:strand:+ start:222 stop:569 length:348 start_codon:yes stop_codon:yes gene_type:complete
MSWTEKRDATKNQLRRLNKSIPDATRGFATLTKAVKEGGTLGFKEKEFVALGIAIALRCEACIVLHTEALIGAGATREEVGDVLAMALQMGGGPAMMYAAKAMECFDELMAEKAA